MKFNWIVAAAAAVLALNGPEKQAMSVRHWAAQRNSCTLQSFFSNIAKAGNLKSARADFDSVLRGCFIQVSLHRNTNVVVLVKAEVAQTWWDWSLQKALHIPCLGQPCYWQQVRHYSLTPALPSAARSLSQIVASGKLVSTHFLVSGPSQVGQVIRWRTNPHFHMDFLSVPV